MARYRKRGALRKFFDYLLTALLFASIALLAAYFSSISNERYEGRFKVVDGDTLLIDGQKLRLDGIDAPEYTQLCGSTKGDWSCGRKATAFLREQISTSKAVSCEGVEVDKYARPLVRCVVDGKDINALMVQEGFAVAYGSYYSEQRQAKNKSIGIWKGRFDLPQDWRRMHHGGIVSFDFIEFFNNVWARLRSTVTAYL